MQPQEIIARALQENWFWSGILRDHAEFIYNGLAPDQEQAVRWATEFFNTFSALHMQARDLGTEAGLPGPAGARALTGPVAAVPVTGRSDREWLELEREAKRVNRLMLTGIRGLLAFKEQVLQDQLDCRIKLNLSPSLIAHMIAEGEEARRTLSLIADAPHAGPALASLHHHLLWMADASGHAAMLHSGLDPAESQLQEATMDFRHLFDGMRIKALELYSMLRVAPRMVGALRRLNRDAIAQIGAFRAFLAELREHLEGCEVMGILMPALADHMLREELYYTEKLLEVEG